MSLDNKKQFLIDVTNVLKKHTRTYKYMNLSHIRTNKQQEFVAH